MAYSLVQQGDPSFRLPLAHALERMDDTWLLGEQRNVAVSSNQDGSALWQFDRTPGSESLRIYPIGSGRAPGSTVIVHPLAEPRRLARAGSSRTADWWQQRRDRLAVLVFRDASAKDYVIEAYHLQIDGTGGVKSESAAFPRLDNVLASVSHQLRCAGDAGSIQRD